jgi:hypothetical protein
MFLEKMRTYDVVIDSNTPFVNRSDGFIRGMNRAGVLSRAATWVMLTELRGYACFSLKACHYYTLFPLVVAYSVYCKNGTFEYG